MSKIDTKPVRLAWPSVAEPLAGLVAELKRQPAYIAQLEAYHRLQADPQAQELLQTARALQSRLQFAWADEDEAQLHQLIDRLNQIPSVQAYGRAEQNLRELFGAIDAVVSQAAGVAFAANAKRSCCGG